MNYLLFTTQTCPKCPEVKQYVTDNVKISGELIDNTHPKFMNIAQKYEVMEAPTFIVLEKGEEIFRGKEVPEIKEFLENM